MASGFGTIRRTSGGLEISCLVGSLGFQSLRLGSSTKPTATLDGRPLDAQATTEDTVTTLRFDAPVTLGAGQKLVLG